MSVLEILTELHQRGVSVTADGDTIVLKPRRALDDVLLARLREAKPAILETLRNRPEFAEPIIPSRADCGCEGLVCQCCWLCAEQHCLCAPQGACWHCGGERRCDCSTCALEERGRPAGPCAACRGTGKVWACVQ
jgi:hypothetical protein